MRSLGCRRFSHLLSELADREPTPKESVFLERHRLACVTCHQEEVAASMSLNLLRGAAFGIDAAPEPGFDRRVLRRAQVGILRDGVRFWSPSLIGGAVAAGLLLAAVQALTKPIAPGANPGIAARAAQKPSLAFNDKDIPKTLRP